MVGTALARANLWEVGGRDNLNQVLVVKRKYLPRNVLNSGVNEVETIFPRIDVSDDAVVYIDKSVLCLLNTGEQTVE